MTSSATATQLGRHIWSSIRDPTNVHLTRLPARRSLSTGIRTGQLLSRPSHSQNDRSFHNATCFFRPCPFPYFRSPRQGSPPKGRLLIGHTSSSTAQSAVTTSTTAASSALVGSAGQRALLSHVARQIWRQGVESNSQRGLSPAPGRRANSSSTRGDGGKQKALLQEQAESQHQGLRKKTPVPDASDSESLANSMSKYLHLPKMPHRPTKEELLAAASGFRERLKVRFKWFSIRSMRPWNADEWGAFVSWFLFGHLVWILVGTTTFFSLVILTINTVFAQETLAKWIGDYLTQSAGLTVVFESAIVPKWRDGVITFRNVFVSRRPGQGRSSVMKGSSNAAAEAAAARQAGQDLAAVEEDADDGNYTQFDVTIDTVNVTLSFIKWWNGKGLLKDVEVKGVRGVVDRTSVHWDHSQDLDPLSYRHEHNPGDFELDYFKLEDLLVTVHQPGGFRPFSVSIFSCELPQLRKQWLFYDFLSATHMSGAFDGSLFTIHPRQIHGVVPGAERRQDEFGEPSAWKKFSRLRIDGLKIDHLNRGVDGPFGWIYEGNVDIVADVMFPADPAEGIGKVVAEFYDKMEEAVTSNRYLRILDDASDRIRKQQRGIDIVDTSTSEAPNDNDDDEAPSQEPRSFNTPHAARVASPIPKEAEEETPSYLVMDMRIHLNDVRAAVPLFNNPHISYVNQALVRPIVAYINAKRTYIPISCRIVKRATDFDGAWTVWDCGLLDDTSAEVYSAFARSVEDQQSRVRRFKRVGLWTVSLVVHALLAGVAGDLM